MPTGMEAWAFLDIPSPAFDLFRIRHLCIARLTEPEHQWAFKQRETTSFPSFRVSRSQTEPVSWWGKTCLHCFPSATQGNRAFVLCRETRPSSLLEVLESRKWPLQRWLPGARAVLASPRYIFAPDRSKRLRDNAVQVKGRLPALF